MTNRFLPPNAVDAYRNKMRLAIVEGGQQVETVAPYLETRVGKRKWLARKGVNNSNNNNNNNNSKATKVKGEVVLGGEILASAPSLAGAL